MAGIAGLNSLPLGLEGVRVTLVLPHPARAALARAVWHHHAPAAGLETVEEWEGGPLPFEDGRFDCVGSVFGAMIAPRPDVAAGELFRVVRPGGTVGMTAWTRGSFTAELIAIGRRYLAPPPDMPVAEEWGDEGTARSRLGPHAARVETERRTIVFRAESAEALAAEQESSAPPTVAARQVLPEEAWREMQRELRELLARYAETDGGPVAIEAEYLQILGRKRG
jgi:SAM-dependent methyltransferase